jgi:hypothetical protein
MSYCAQSNLFFGVNLCRDDLFKALGFDPEGDHYEEVEEVVRAAGFNFLSMGNMVVDGHEHGIAIINFETDEGVIPIPSEKMTVDPKRLGELKAFLNKYGISEEPGWHLGATYG